MTESALISVRNVHKHYGRKRVLRGVSLEVKAGDKIIVGKYAGSEIKLDEVEFVILREDDVLGIVK